MLIEEMQMFQVAAEGILLDLGSLKEGNFSMTVQLAKLDSVFEDFDSKRSLEVAARRVMSIVEKKEEIVARIAELATAG